jgi:hypothetical protein
MVVFDMIGAHGEGKTAIASDYVRKIIADEKDVALTQVTDDEVAKHLTVIQGGGITDFASSN